MVDGCNGEIAVVVEHSLIGLEAFVSGAAVEGVSGWASWESRLTFEAGISVTFCAMGAWPSLSELDTCICCSVLLVCEPVHDVDLADGCQVWSQGALWLRAVCCSSEV